MATKRNKTAPQSGTYAIRPRYKGLIVWAVSPEYEREQGSKFVLDDNLSQQDLGYLYEVIGHEGVELIG